MLIRFVLVEKKKCLYKTDKYKYYAFKLKTGSIKLSIHTKNQYGPIIIVFSLNKIMGVCLS